jgi:hypothetical protein
MKREEIPKPRLFSLSHPRLKRIRTNLRKVIQLAASERWNKILAEQKTIRKEGLKQQKREYYSQLTIESKLLREYFNKSIISNGSGYIEGAKADVSGDRVRVFVISTFDSTDNFLVEKRFFPVKEYECKKELYDRNYEAYAHLYKDHPERFYTFNEFYFNRDEFFGR